MFEKGSLLPAGPSSSQKTHWRAMSPVRRHGGGRPRSANSVLSLVERYGISEKAARRLAGLQMDEEAMTILVRDSQRYAAAQRREIPGQGKFSGGMRALGMRSRVPAGRP
jgi:hypothetical protein